jgi:uncharacterized protein (TIGR01777 family)
MRILISGASGFVGSALIPFLAGQGHEVSTLSRNRPNRAARALLWNPVAGSIDTTSIEGFDAIIHLAGANLAAGRWTAERKRLIRDSRVEGTRLLARALARLQRPPGVLLSASAIGYYGDRGPEILTENSPPGSGFLAEVCRDWEAAAATAEQGGIRVALLRMGMVLSPAGGALPRMLAPFRLGFGGRLGTGCQYMSWIILDDLLQVISSVLLDGTTRGPINVVAPEAVTNRDFTKILGRVLGRLTVLPVPAMILRLVFGEMGEQLLLSSARVQPARLLAAGHSFLYPRLEPALRHCLSRKIP